MFSFSKLPEQISVNGFHVPGSVLDARDAAMNKADKRNPYPSGAYLLLGETINAIGKRKSKGEEVEVRLNAGH